MPGTVVTERNTGASHLCTGTSSRALIAFRDLLACGGADPWPVMIGGHDEVNSTTLFVYRAALSRLGKATGQLRSQILPTVLRLLGQAKRFNQGERGDQWKQLQIPTSFLGVPQRWTQSDYALIAGVPRQQWTPRSTPSSRWCMVYPSKFIVLDFHY